ncbi:hypothetical protein BN946_scf184825.g2 [Trametes cinnabarina]|uniref:Uncharacterized protein n=1 Tax=Pycnoporus cinnabarinus TaxID=5643 RepID=A0A060SSU7_PYCCI|nr:hypothetical protein BN946_scf184825.g2 [Trametes cinnabarina]
MLSSRPIPLNPDVDVASQPILQAKTPARKLKNRAALQENAIIHSGAKTVLSKKHVLQTPFRPGTAHGKKPLGSMSVTRPLMDKTPFPNRVAATTSFGASKTPGTKGSKLSKLSFLVPEPEQSELLSPDIAPLLRPSNTRKSLRGRLSGTFKTPVTKGDHWNVSPGDLRMDLADGSTEQATEQVPSLEDEDDEIEYMPPTAIDLPYEPPFELPDYKAVGMSLFKLGHVPLEDDTIDIFYSQIIDEQLDMPALIAESGPPSVDVLALPELEDDSPFAKKAAKPGPSACPSKPALASTRIPSGRTASAVATPWSHSYANFRSKSSKSGGFIQYLCGAIEEGRVGKAYRDAARRCPSGAASVPGGRARSATVSVPSGGPGASRVSTKPTAVIEDPLAEVFEKNIGDGLYDDFQFEI